MSRKSLRKVFLVDFKWKDHKRSRCEGPFVLGATPAIAFNGGGGGTSAMGAQMLYSGEAGAGTTFAAAGASFSFDPWANGEEARYMMSGCVVVRKICGVHGAGTPERPRQTPDDFD